MVAPFFKKNSLEQTHFELTPTGLLYRGKAYLFSDVVETKSVRVIHQTRYVTMAIKEQHDPAMSFILVMRNGDLVQVTETSTWTYSSKQGNVDLLQAAFDKICKETFAHRLQKYVSQVKNSGFFNYGGCRFFPAEGQIISDKGCSCRVPETSFLRSYGYIEMVPKKQSLGEKLLRKAKQELGASSSGIDTLVDSDVFFALLNHYFHLKWQEAGEYSK